MRIVLVNKFAHITGGADRHCLELAAILRERGHEVAFLSTFAAANVEQNGHFVSPSVTSRTRGALPLNAQAVVAVKAFWNSEAAAAMRRLLDVFRPDVVHAHKLYPQLSVAPVVVAARNSVRVVQTLHDYELVSASWADARGGKLDLDESRASYRLLNSTLLPVRRLVHARRVDAFVSVSRLVARVYASHGIESLVIPNFVRSDIRRTATAFADREGIIYFGRLAEEKGVRDVVELARRLVHVRVTIVGSGPLETEVRECAEALPNLVVLGFKQPDEISELVRRARLAVVPSRWQEPGPLVPLEAMAAGTPVIAYANGGLAEYVADTGGGRVVPADVDVLAHACGELIDDERGWKALSARAVAGVAKQHDATLYAERLEDVYAGVSASPQV